MKNKEIERYNLKSNEIKLPAKKISDYSDGGNAYRHGWNDCLDEIHRLNFEIEEDADGTEKD